MHVGIVGGALPYPATSGSRIRMLNLLVRLARRHRITYVGTRNPDRAEGNAALDYLKDHGIQAVEVAYSVPPKSGIRFYARLVANLASSRPYSVSSHQTPELAREVERIALRESVDLWQAEWVAGVEALRGLKGARKLVVAQNVETVIWERYRATETNPLSRWFVGGQGRKFERYERRAFSEAHRVVAVSEEDAALIRKRFGVSRVDVVENGIDRKYFEAVVPERDPRRLLFLGSMDWRPNLDAVGLLLDRIFPLVRAAEPGVSLDIVGRNPPAALARRVAETEGVVLHANVPDVRPFLGRGGVMAVPLRVGGGSRLKILEALATGLPVVSTRVGAEGLLLRDSVELTIADDPAAFAAALVDAVRNPAAALRCAERGRRFVLERYDWDAVAVGMERSWESCVGANAAREFARS